MRLAQLADGGQIGHLSTRVGHGFHEHHTGVGLQRTGHLADTRGIDRGHLDAKIAQGAQHAVGVAKHKLADHDVIARFEQREKRRTDGRHAGGKTDGAHAAFEQVDARFQRGRGRRALSGVVVALDRALEHAHELFHRLEAVLHGGVNGFAHAAVLHAKAAVCVDDSGVDAVGSHLVSAFSFKVAQCRALQVRGARHPPG